MLDRLWDFIRIGPVSRSARPPPTGGTRRETLLSFSRNLSFLPPPDSTRRTFGKIARIRMIADNRGRAFPVLPLYLDNAGESVSLPPVIRIILSTLHLALVFRQWEIDRLNFFSLCAAPAPNSLLSPVPSPRTSLDSHTQTIIFHPINHLANITRH